MTSQQPPRWAVRLLESLGAEAQFRDDVIGDMAEEFALRSGYDGKRAARRWYVREAWRTFPYLVRDWARRFRGRDLAYFAGVVCASYAVVFVVAGVAFTALRVAFATIGIYLDGPLPWSDRIFRYVAFPLMALLGTKSALFGGYVAALIGRRAPLVSAFALGIFWAGVSLFVIAVSGAMHLLRPIPFWWLAIQPVFLVACTTAGGLLRVCTTARAAKPEQLESL